MIKLSRTGITTLKRQYKSVLLKCLLINAGILLAAGSANATNYTVNPGSFHIGSDYVTGEGSVSVTGLAISDTTGLQDALNSKTTLSEVVNDATNINADHLGAAINSLSATQANSTITTALADGGAIRNYVEGQNYTTLTEVINDATNTDPAHLGGKIISTVVTDAANTGTGHLGAAINSAATTAAGDAITTALGDGGAIKSAIATATTGMLTTTNYSTTLDSVYVKQETGKGLSSNDYTDADAAKVAALGTASTKDVAATFTRDSDPETTLNAEINTWATVNTGKLVSADDLKTAVTGKQDAFTVSSNSGLKLEDGYLGVNSDESTIGVNATSGKLEVKDSGITSAKIADGTVAKVDLATAVQNNLLDNATTGNGLVITDGTSETAAKISLKLNETASGLVADANGLAVKLNGTSLATTADGLAVNIKNKGGLTSTADGLAIVTGSTTKLSDTGALEVKDLQVSDFKSGVIVTTIGDDASDAQLATALATKTAIKTGAENADYTNTVATTATHISHNTLQGAIADLDTTIGDMDGFDSNHYAKSETSVAANLDALDDALFATDSILGKAETNTPVTTSLLVNKIGSDADNTVVKSLRTVADNAAGLHMDNTFDGSNTFTKNTTFEKGITVGTTGVLSEQTGVTFNPISGSAATDQKIMKVTDASAFVVDGASAAATGGFSVINKDSDGIYSEVASLNKNGLTITGKTGTETTATVKFSVDAATGNVETAGTVKIDTVTLTGADDKLVSDKKVVSENGFEVNDTTSLAENLLTVGDSSLSNTALTIGKASAITGTEGSLDMGANAVSNVKGLTLTDGAATDPKTVALTVDTNGELSVSEIIDATKGLRFSSDETAMTSVVRDAVAAKAATGSDAVVVSATALQATRAAIDADAHTVLGGVYKIDDTEKTVSYDTTALSNNMFKYADGSALAAGDDLTASLGKFASSLNAITGGTIDDEGKVNNNYVVVDTESKPVIAYGTSAATVSLAQAIGQVSNNIGTAIDASTIADRTTGKIASTATVNANIAALDTAVGSDADLTTGTATITARGANNGVKVENSVNANIATLNSAIGDLSDLHVTYTATGVTGNAMTFGGENTTETVVDALNNIDATLGTIHGLAKKLEDAGTYQGNLAAGTTVEQHLTALDAAIGDRSQFATGRYTATSESVADATMALDKGLSDLADDVRDFKKEFKSGMAQMAAMSALVPNARAHGNTQLSVGTGTYEGHTAAAVGGFHWVNDNLLLNAGVSYGNSNNVVYRAGLTWSW